MKKVLGLLSLVAMLFIASPSWSLSDNDCVTSYDGYTIEAPSVCLVATLDVVLNIPNASLVALVPSLKSPTSVKLTDDYLAIPDKNLDNLILNTINSDANDTILDDDVGWSSNYLYSTLTKSNGTVRNDLPLLVPLLE